MNELEEQHRLRANGCGCLLALIGCLIPISCFLIPIFLFFQSTSREVTNEIVIFESSSPNENYTLSIIQRGISFHGKYLFYIEVDDGTRIEVNLVCHEDFDDSNVLIEWSDDHHAIITLDGDYAQTISFTAPNYFEWH